MDAIGIGPTLALRPRDARPAFDFGNGVLPPGAVLARATAATRWDAGGVLTNEGAGVARFDHDPVTHARLGLLIEGAATNLALHSQDFADPGWIAFLGLTKIGVAPVAAPDGSFSAYEIGFVATGESEFDNSQAFYREPGGASVGATYGFTLYVRAKSGTADVRMGIFPGAAPSIGTGSLAVSDAGWTRLAVSATAQGDTVNISVRSAGPSGGGSVYVWGAAFEAGAQPTSYVPTLSAAATRAADVLTLDWASRGAADGAAVTRYTFDDGSSQDVPTTIAAGKSTVPTSLNRRWITRAVLA